jgi:hypothetical protein
MTNENKPNAGMMKVVVETATRVAGGRAAALFQADGWEIEAGGDIYSANRDGDREIRNAMTDMLMMADAVWPDVTTNAGGVFLRGDRAFSGVLDFSATARLDLAGSEAGRPSDWFIDNVSDRTSTSSTNLSGAATLGMHLSRNWMLFTGAGSAVRNSCTVATSKATADDGSAPAAGASSIIPMNTVNKRIMIICSMGQYRRYP